jgi:thiol:disulfide interchange protein DsbC
MKKLALTSLLLSALTLNSAFAAEKVSTKKEFADIEMSLKKNNPDIPAITSIKTTPVPGIYEIVVNESNIFYSDKEGKYFFFGNLVKSENGQKVSLTEERMQILTQLNFKDLKFSDAITRKIGNGKNVIVTFEDPNCGFCKKLHPELAKLNNVTIHTFIIPILGEGSKEVSKAILCSKDPAKEWDEFMKGGAKPSVSASLLEKCDTSALDRNVTLSKKIGVAGTPAVFFENGRSLKGYALSDKIVELMNAAPLKK